MMSPVSVAMMIAWRGTRQNSILPRSNAEHRLSQLGIPGPVADPDAQQSLAEICAGDASLLFAIDTDDGAKLRQIIDRDLHAFFHLLQRVENRIELLQARLQRQPLFGRQRFTQ